MKPDTRRDGDHRPIRHNGGLSVVPSRHWPLRWLPRHGEPWCIIEWFSQWSVRVLTYAPIYTAIVVTITLALVMFGVPFVAG